MKTFSVGQFTHTDGTYTTEASDLGLAPGEIPREIGITHRSGVVSQFQYLGVDRGRDGDVTAFRYCTQDQTMELLVLND